MRQSARMTRKHWGITLILSFCGAVALSMQFQQPLLPEQPSVLAEIFWNLQYSLQGTSVCASLLFAAFTGSEIVIHRFSEKRIPAKLLLPACFLISLIWLAGESFSINNTLEMLDASPGQVVKSVCYVLGSTYLLFQLGRIFFCLLDKGGPEKNHCSGRAEEMYRTHPFWVSFGGLLLGWSPYVIAANPGYMCYDSWAQLEQFFGEAPFTAGHPPMHTLFLGVFVWLGQALGNINLGLFLSIAVQTVITAGILSYSLLLMKKWNTPEWLRIISFTIMVLCPYYATYVEMAIKDTLYSACFLLFLLEVMCMLEKGTDYFFYWKHRILLTLSIMGTILFRNNGKYVLYPTVIVLMIYFGKSKQHRTPLKKIAGITLTLVAPIILAGILTSAVTAHFQIGPGSIREALSLPFQQTARYVLERKDEITEEEAAAISAVLGYEYLGNAYNPIISDPVKGSFNEDATDEDLMRYFSVWLSQFFKHPEIYIKATLNQNYFLLYPFVENSPLYSSTVPGFDWIIEFNNKLGIQVSDELEPARSASASFYGLMYSVPVIGLLSNQAAYNLALIFLLIFSVYRKKWRWIIMSVPVILSFWVVVLAPAIQGNPRYAFPIIYSIPVMTAYYIYLSRFDQEEKKEI